MAPPSRTIAELLSASPVVPVLEITDPDSAIPLARALVAGGLPALEVTLRTPHALEAIGRMGTVAGAIPGAGTVLDGAQLHQVRDAGARFAVSPGATPELLAAAAQSGLPFLPGIATASEAMAARAVGFSLVKFFPASAAGGPGFLKALAAPLADMRFCPTGGISADNLEDYLRLPGVVAVGGSWVAPRDAVAAGDWGRIEALARAARQAAETLLST